MDTNREKKPKRKIARANQEIVRKGGGDDSSCAIPRHVLPSTMRSRERYNAPGISARLYDKRVCDRFADMSCALNILAEDAREQNEVRVSELIAQSLRIDLVGSVREHARSDVAALRAICMKYDLTVAPFITSDENVQQYFIALSGAMIDSELCRLGTKFVKSVRDIIKFIDMVRECACAQGSSSLRASSKTKTKTGTKQSTGTGERTVIAGNTSQSSRVSSRARANALARASALDECVTCCARSYVGATFDGLYSKLSIAVVYATCAIDDIEPVVRADNSADMKCPRCNTFMRPLEQCVIVCDKCGRIRDISVIQSSCKGPTSDSGDVTITQDDAAHGGMSQSLTSARNFDRHLRTWLERMQAIEPFIIPTCDLERIRHAIECESIGLSSRTITYAEVVRAIKICSLNDSYSEHAPNIVKMLGGRAPPVLSHEAQQIIMRDFVHIMEVYTSNGIGNIGNKPYYPFFIAKIIKRRFARGSEPRRLIDYISSQGRETVCKNDEIYRMICAHAPPQYDLKYEPEDV